MNKSRAHNFNVRSDHHDILVFLEAQKFVVAIYRQHWNRRSRKEFTDHWEALAELQSDPRALLYAITEVGRTATFGQASAERLEHALLEEAAKKARK